MKSLNIPNGTAGIRLSADSIKYMQTGILEQMLMYARKYFSTGILSAIDPSLTGSPMEVTELDSTTLQISPGFVLFASGELVASPTIGTIAKPLVSGDFLVTAKIKNTFSGTQITDFAETVTLFAESSIDFALVPIEQYAQVAGYSEVLAIYNLDTNAISLTHNTLSIRRWSSPYDWDHRGKVGSGVVTETNPHATTLLNLSLTETLSVWKGLGASGIVSLGKDVSSNYRFYGMVLKETVHESQFTESNFYITLRTPFVCPLKITVAGNANAPVTLKGQDNLARRVIVDRPASGQSIDIYTLVVPTLAFQQLTSNPFKLQELIPQASDILVTEKGDVFTRTASKVFDLSPYSDYPNYYIVVMDDSGLPQLTPRQLISSIALVDFSAEPLQVNQILLRDSRVQILLGNTTANPLLNLSLKITGLTSLGVSINETVTFDSTWTATFPNNLKTTLTNFATVLTVEQLTATAVDIGATIQINYSAGPSYTGATGNFSGEYLVAAFELTAAGIVDFVDLRNLMAGPANAQSLGNGGYSAISDATYYPIDNLQFLCDWTNSDFPHNAIMMQGYFNSAVTDMLAGKILTFEATRPQSITLRWQSLANYGTNTWTVITITGNASAAIPAGSGRIQVISLFAGIKGIWVS